MEPLEAALRRAGSGQASAEAKWRHSRGGRRIVLLAPHPDDEAIGAGGSLLLEARAGSDTIVLFLTDGARGASGRGGEGAVRRQEAAASANVLDLSGYVISPWQSSDLRRDPGAAAEALAAMFTALAPAEIWMTSPYEGHPTHLATTLAGLAAVGRVPGLATSARVLGYETWDPIPAGPGLLARDISAVVDDKARAIRCHRSQCSVRAFDEAILARNRSEALLAAHTGELSAAHVEHFLDLAPIVARTPREIGSWLADRTRDRFESVRAQLT